MKQEQPTHSEDNVERSAGEQPVTSFISDHGTAGIAVWHPTDRFMESVVNESGEGGCLYCHENIVGEDARYYTHEEVVRSSITDSGKPSRLESVTTMKFAMRKHYIGHHMRSVPASNIVVSVEPVVEAKPKSKIPTSADYVTALHEAEEMQVHVLFLERELAFARNALDKLYKVISNMPVTVRPRQPFKSDIKVTCHKCGVKTLWRTGKGAGECYPICEEKRVAVNREVRNASEAAAFRVLFDETEE